MKTKNRRRGQGVQANLLLAAFFALCSGVAPEARAGGYPENVQSSSDWLRLVDKHIETAKSHGYGWAVIEFTVASVATDMRVDGRELLSTELEAMEDIVVHSGSLPQSVRITTPVSLQMHDVHGVVTVGWLKGSGAQYWVAPGDRVLALVYGLPEDSEKRHEYPGTGDLWSIWLAGQLQDGYLSIVTEVRPTYTASQPSTLARRALSALMSQVEPVSWASEPLARNVAVARIRERSAEVESQ